MKTTLNPYINFNGNAREAMEFYHSVFGGKLDLNTFGEFHDMASDPAEKDKIMHGMIMTDELTLMGSDTPSSIPYKEGSTISISLSGDNEDLLKGYWDKLSDGGKITVPIEKAPWGDTFGMFDDKFGVSWLVNIQPKA